MTLRMLIVLPTWLHIWTHYPFLPKIHPWKQRGKMFTLKEWAEGATPVTILLSLNLWIGSGLVVSLFWLEAAK